MNKMIERIAEYYGYETQSRQLIEEMAELTQAINKLWRYDNGHISSGGGVLKMQVAEEIADSLIMLYQIEFLLDCIPEVQEIYKTKLKRQIERINSGECHE